MGTARARYRPGRSLNHFRSLPPGWSGWAVRGVDSADSALRILRRIPGRYTAGVVVARTGLDVAGPMPNVVPLVGSPSY